MANWVQRLDERIAVAKRPPKHKRGSKHEDGQTCPRCGDLYTWTSLYCPRCRMPLK